MTCRSCSRSALSLGRLLSQTAKLMVGVPDYGAYVAHSLEAHPDRTPMTREQFVRNRVDRRYGAGPGGMMRCC